MRPNTVVSALLASSLCAAGTAWVRWQRLATAGVPDRVGVAPLRMRALPVPDDSLADAEESITTNDPFRLSNSPAVKRYDPVADAGLPGLIAAPPQPRPTLVLKAIVGGPPWQAVIDGIPGQPPGTVAQAGTKFDRLTIRSVTRDSVIVQGADTSWVLSFKAR